MQSSRAECMVAQPVVPSWRLGTGAVSATTLLLVAAALWVGKEGRNGMSGADLLIDGPQSQAALAQQLVPGEVDRILLRVGVTPETAAYEYTAKLRVQYNGTCTAESLPFALSHEATLHPARVPLPQKK